MPHKGILQKEQVKADEITENCVRTRNAFYRHLPT